MGNETDGTFDAFTSAIREYFLEKLGDAAAGNDFNLNFDPLPISAPLSAFIGQGGQFSPAKAVEFFSRNIADRAAYIQKGSRFSSVESLSDVIRFNVLEKAVHFRRFDQSEELVAKDIKAFESQLAEAKKRIGSTLVSSGPIAEEFVASSAIPETWLDPTSAENWSSYRQVIVSKDDGNTADSHFEPKGVEFNWRRFDPDELKKLLERWKPKEKWPPPGFDINEIDNRPRWMDPAPSTWKDVDLSILAKSIVKPGDLFSSKGSGAGLGHAAVVLPGHGTFKPAAGGFGAPHAPGVGNFGHGFKADLLLDSLGGGLATEKLNPAFEKDGHIGAAKFMAFAAVPAEVKSIDNFALLDNETEVDDGTTKVTDTHVSTSTTVQVTQAQAFEMAALFKNSVASKVEATTSTGMKDKVEISFKYQVVGIRRSWLFMSFLTSSNWFIPDARRGSLSGSDGDRMGVLNMIAQKFIVIKDVTIKADFSDADMDAISGAFAIGPFGLNGATSLQNGALTIPGLQIIAYLDQTLPVIPPRSAPSIVS